MTELEALPMRRWRAAVLALAAATEIETGRAPAEWMEGFTLEQTRCLALTDEDAPAAWSNPWLWLSPQCVAMLSGPAIDFGALNLEQLDRLQAWLSAAYAARWG